MGRRVKPGDKLTISAAEYNRLLAAADVASRSRLKEVPPKQEPLHRSAGIVRVHNTGPAVDIGRVVGLDSVLSDPTNVVNDAAAVVARFARLLTLKVGKPLKKHVARFGITIEPIPQNGVGRLFTLA